MRELDSTAPAPALKRVDAADAIAWAARRPRAIAEAAPAGGTLHLEVPHP